MNRMEQTSEYYSTRSLDLKTRHTEKITGTGLKTDPCVIQNKSWTEEHVSVPQVSWSDMFLYMISTPSPYIKQEMKVCY